MSPPRMVRSGDPFDRALLRAGRSDDPPRGAEDRALAALGLSMGLAARSIAARPRPPSTLQWGWSLKAVAIALAVGAAVAGAWIAGFRPASLAAPVAPSVRSEAVPPPVVRSVAPVGSETAGPMRSPASTAPVAVPTAEPLRPAARVPSSAPLAPAHGPPVAAPALSVEIALVQQAARALASGDAAVALSLLDTYDRQCPHGALADEAGALRVQALARTGRAPEARALARKLLDAHPHGVLATRLKGVLDGPLDAEGH
jgi:hypothetical protein